MFGVAWVHDAIVICFLEQVVLAVTEAGLDFTISFWNSEQEENRRDR